MTDRRLTPATATVALESLRGVLDRPAYVPGVAARVAAPVTDLCREPQGARDRQLIFGADVTVIDDTAGWSFVQASADGYCGYVRSDVLTADLPPVTHRVAAPATHVYPGPDMKRRELRSLTMGSALSVVTMEKGFVQLADGGWVPEQHVTDAPATDAASVAEKLIGTPYLWGGNSRWGIDCSGLAQAGLLACGIPCPGDSDLQWQQVGTQIDPQQVRRGDLLFWKGHVAMAVSPTRMIHATAWKMAVIYEDIDAARTRIMLADDGEFLGVRRPGPKG